MSIRTSVVLLVLFLSLSTIYSAEGKNNKKQQLPNYVLEAHRVLVVIRPDAGEPVTNPTANRNAEEAVESAISKWGRFTLVMDAQAADLIIAVRKGQASGPVIGNSPIDNRTVIFQPNDGGVRIGGQQGRSPDLTNPGIGTENRGPGIGGEIGTSDDLFEVYRAGPEHPLDAPAIWRYSAKNALKGPEVPAVEQFRKTIEETEKQRQKKP